MATKHCTSLERVANGPYRMEEMTEENGCGVINIASEKTNRIKDECIRSYICSQHSTETIHLKVCIDVHLFVLVRSWLLYIPMC